MFEKQMSFVLLMILSHTHFHCHTHTSTFTKIGKEKQQTPASVYKAYRKHKEKIEPRIENRV
jgi:ribosomal protein S30